MAEKIKVIVKKPGKAPYVTRINNTLESFQRMVEGYIENFQVTDTVAIVCNEEGRLKGMEYNFHFGSMPFFGPCFFAGTDVESGEYTDCPVDMNDMRKFCPSSFMEG